MNTISLAGAASYMPPDIIDGSFFGEGGASSDAMFHGPRTRRHVGPTETAASMVGTAWDTLAERLNLDAGRDVDVILTNTACPDQFFTGSGASIAKRVGARPSHVLDLHNTGCTSFVFLLMLARQFLGSNGARGALLCNIQNGGGRIFNHPENRRRPQSAIPGDGCGIAYLVPNEESPVRSVVTRCFTEYADDMCFISDDNQPWWQPRNHALHVDFSEAKVKAVVRRGRSMVPEIVREACAAADLSPADIGILITNQPNRGFLRGWREDLGVPPERHLDTFEEYGNLFGAAHPIGIERAIATGALKAGDFLALGGFSHAGDYAAGAIIHWRAAR